MAPNKKQLPVFTVTQLNSLIKASLDNALPGRMLLRAEVSNWKQHSSGHCYFVLKDSDGGQIPCVMWASKFRSLKFDCENGLAVLATGHVDVYLPGGKYRVRIRERVWPYMEDYSDAEFTVVGPHVIQPSDAGIACTRGSVYPIRWEGFLGDTVRLQVWKGDQLWLFL